MRLKSHFTFNSKQRSGILLLLLLISCLIGFFWYYDFSEEDVFDITSPEIISIQRELDSLRLAKKQSGAQIYPFNPNYITDYRGYSLGMTNEEIDRLHRFRDSGKWVNSASEFQAVTLVSDSLLEAISPYFKFPEWVNRPKSNKVVNKGYKGGFTEKPYHLKIDLNTATIEELQEVNGIGETLAKRIVAYRARINGFSNDTQLYAVYGLNDEVIRRVLNLFTVKDPKEIIKFNINTASASDLSTIPGISYEQARKIWEFRRLRERITSLDELDQIDGITKGKLELFQLYLSVD